MVTSEPMIEVIDAAALLLAVAVMHGAVGGFCHRGRAGRIITQFHASRAHWAPGLSERFDGPRAGNLMESGKRPI